ncbi:hypothetical protein CsatB_020847 [Cannabis sativa]|uniref:LysM domain-containing protein n=1 Tax=Cannabis sativa TaxID=3483 RepID=A0A7J6GHZ6_CANSA|nr:hypothetical protein F8388_015383 [Cannabis sativa]KAF4394363.1 hypothetical protein G4B88_018513 [Cannabis sativa]
MPIAESIQIGSGFAGKKNGKLVCQGIYGVQSGDNCAGIVKMFSLDSETFTFINPNLVCNNIFAGQWVCVSGQLN